MNATTNLKFTLTSPGSTTPGTTTPTTPTTTPTTTPGTVTYVTSPNTGENSAGSDSISGSVFSTLFIAIGLAALIVFLVKYLKKTRKLSFAKGGSFHISARSRIAMTSALVLAIAFLGSTIISQFYKDHEGRADAATVNLDVRAANDLTFNVSRGGSNFLSDNVVVDNKGAEYTLYVYTSSDKFCLNNDTSSTCLSSVTGNIASKDPSSLSSISTNQWGVSLIGNEVTGKIWANAPVSNTGTQIYKGTSSTTPVYYAVSAGTDLPDGTYYAKVSYRAVSTTDSNLEYTVITRNGFVGQTGEETEEDFLDGAKVYIRHNCGSKKFLGWTIDEGDLELSDITAVANNDNLFTFTMPASDVKLTATCEGDTPATVDWIIKYDANGGTGTMADTAVAGTTTTLRANSFTRTNYQFLGWACDKNATAADFTDKQGDITKAALEAKLCTKTTTDGKDTYTLYAIWKINEPEYLQDVSAEYCDSLKVLDTRTMKDKRDNKSYSFRKFADGRCWMLSDLDYDLSVAANRSLTKDTSDVSAARTLDSSAKYAAKSGNYSALYNYKAATAGTWNNQSVNTVMTDSICPANWKMPDNMHSNTDRTPGEASGEQYRLFNYNIGAGPVSNNPLRSTAITLTAAGGRGKSDSWKTSFMLAGNNNSTYYGPHFTKNGYYDFDGGNGRVQSGSYGSYFLNTIWTGEGSEVKAGSFNLETNGTIAINVTDFALGSAIRCLLRTEKQRTQRDYIVPSFGDLSVETNDGALNAKN